MYLYCTYGRCTSTAWPTPNLSKQRIKHLHFNSCPFSNKIQNNEMQILIETSLSWSFLQVGNSFSLHVISIRPKHKPLGTLQIHSYLESHEWGVRVFVRSLYTAHMRESTSFISSTNDATTCGMPSWQLFNELMNKFFYDFISLFYMEIIYSNVSKAHDTWLCFFFSWLFCLFLFFGEFLPVCHRTTPRLRQTRGFSW